MPGRLTRATLGAILVLVLPAGAAAAAQTEVFSVVPAFSPYNVANRSMTLKGIGFTASSAVSFDGVAATTTFINSRTLVAVIPTVGAPKISTITVSDPANGSDDFMPFFYSGPVLYVANTGNDANAGTSPGAPKLTLAATFAAVDGVTPTEIRVAGGYYRESQLSLLNGSVLSCGWAPGFGLRDPDGNVSEIDGGRTSYAIRTSGLMNMTVVDGCTITNGLQDGFGGGGLVISADTTIVNNNVIAGNTSTISGGGIYWRASTAYGGKPTFSNNVIVGNRSHNKNGGGIGVYAFYNTVEDVKIMVSGNQIVGNRSFNGRGGGVSLTTGTYAGYNNGILHLSDNVIAENEAKTGGGVALTTNNYADLYDTSMKNNLIAANMTSGAGGGVAFQGVGTYTGEMTGNTIADNMAGPFQGGGLLIGGGVSLAPGFSASDMILWGNTGEDVAGLGINAVTWSISGTTLSGQGDLSLDPDFVAGQFGGYYLRQNDPNLPDSPAVDAGSGTAGDFSVDPLTTSLDSTGDSGANDMGYHYLGAIPPSSASISVARVDPAVGDIHGNDWILVRGDGFDPGASVFFGGVEATETLYLGYRRILAKPAPHAVGFVTVRVTNPDTTTNTLISGYLYLDDMPPVWTSTVGVISATGGIDQCQRAVLLDWNPATDTDSPPVLYDIYREECTVPTVPGVPCDNFGYIPQPANRIATTDQTYFVDNTMTSSGQAKQWVYAVRAHDSAAFFTNREWNFGKRLALGNAGATETPPEEVGDSLRFVTGDPHSFTWANPTGAINYGFYRTANPSDYTTVPTLPLLITLTALNNDADGDGHTDTAYTDPTDPPLGQAFYYKVSAKDSCSGETISEILP
ncbi:MAG TPA: IPT/TIG domain-containing protein [Candidatus Saccharimonadales bacterium]|nr:IPT/TIG domain-containing protein [Candidatus Saccharimonadales bacterium]